LRLLSDAQTTRASARGALRAWLDGSEIDAAIHEARGATSVDAVEQIVAKVVAENPEVAAKVRSGKSAAVNFLVGESMKRLLGKARPDDVRAAVHKALQSGP
ncbi:MAG TPA: GatB/YqeY domain-containing protein, partial [Burkholderiales bacterium]|nr:GatB/YqeY domain-containing protein [Burkholderiales bacterium]